MQMVMRMFVLGSMLLFGRWVLVVLVFALRIEPVFPAIYTGIKRIRYGAIPWSELLLTLESFEQLLVLLFGFTLRVHDLSREGCIGTCSSMDR
jgi:hypothetical protein